MKNSSVRTAVPFRVVGEGGEGVVAHVRLHVLGRFADSIGVTGALSKVFHNDRVIQVGLLVSGLGVSRL